MSSKPQSIESAEVPSDLERRRRSLQALISECADLDLLETLSTIAGCETEVRHVTRWERDGIYAEAFIDEKGRLQFAVALRDKNGQWGTRTTFSITDPEKRQTVLPVGSELVLLPGMMSPAAQDPDKLFCDLLAFIQRYVTLTDEFTAGLAAWLLGTWVHQRFEAFPLLRLYGPPTAGKSRVQKIIVALAYHPMPRLSAAREALVVRCIQIDHPTMVLDETDKAPDANMADVIRSGFERDGYVIRNDGEGYTGRKFPSYCPKSISGQAPMTDSALMTRMISENMGENERAEDVVDDLSGDARVAFEAEAASLRARCFRFAMDHGPTLKPLRPDVPALDDRGRQVFRPLWTLTPSDAIPLLNRLARRYIQGLSSSMSSTNDGWIGAAVVQITTEKGASVTFTAPDIGVLANDLATYELGMTEKQIAESLRRIGCRQGKLHSTTRRATFSVHPNTLRKLQRLYGPSEVGEDDSE